MPLLADVREEQFAQLVASGKTVKDARKEAGYPHGGKWSMKRLMIEPRIKERIDELRSRAAHQAVLSRVDILNGIVEEWRLSRLAAQHGASLKAAEMLGSELHGMFRKQMEVGRPGEFDSMTEDQLKVFIADQLKLIGLTPAQLIEAEPLGETKPDQEQPDTTSK